MTEEMQKLLEEQLGAADTPEDVDRAMVAAMKALIDCQRKTAERVKTLAIDADRRRHKIEGAAILWRVLGIAAASGGGAAILKLLGALQNFN